MKNEASPEEIIALIENELRNISELIQELKRYKNKNSRLYRRAKGSILHDFYNCCERVFKIISKEIDGNLSSVISWHKELLNKMRMDVPGLRTKVISEKLAAKLNEYLSFRHLFRNIYGFELDSDRLDYLVNKFESVAEQFIQEIRRFIKKL